ncbi:DUF4303 domain-containing protein [Streptomyces sp. NPDC014724]|uniref:DUF4303 domain-containing protein n=1 Tax=unclassified Streptomyces TaxID=2593676 RepID=UPI0036FA072C
MEPDSLLAALLPAARAAFTELANTMEQPEYCGYALYSDAGAMTVSCAVNTPAHLVSAQAGDPDDAAYYTWTPAEWALEGVGHEHFTGLSQHLLALSAADPTTDLLQRRAMVYEACVATLEALVTEGVLGRGEDTVVVFALSDHSDPEREVDWIRRLNPPSQARRFARWLHSTSVQA